MTQQVSEVVRTLLTMCGVWRDHLTAYHPDGTPMPLDTFGGSPGAFPYDNLVYIDFDGERYVQTNVAVQGRPLEERTFCGSIIDGVLHFDKLGPEDPGQVGVSGGPGVLCYVPSRVTEAMARFADPDFIRLLGADQRTRVTTLYRNGELKRVLTVAGHRISDDPTVRMSYDPRGADGPVHKGHHHTLVYRDLHPEGTS